MSNQPDNKMIAPERLYYLFHSRRFAGGVERYMQLTLTAAMMTASGLAVEPDYHYFMVMPEGEHVNRVIRWAETGERLPFRFKRRGFMVWRSVIPKNGVPVPSVVPLDWSTATLPDEFYGGDLPSTWMTRDTYLTDHPELDTDRWGSIEAQFVDGVE